MPPPSTVRDIEPPAQITAIAVKGFLAGAGRFGAISILTHLALHRTHPIYRGLTLQFKVFLQLSAMMLGGYVFADKRVTEYNDAVRAKRRALARSAHTWNEEQELRAQIEAEVEAERAGRTQ
ncbi:hypothetical protein DV735_g2303, partial [Chaetothyriales sp. CBS 134920]